MSSPLSNITFTPHPNNILHIDQDPQKRALDPCSTVNTFASFGTCSEPSRPGYRSGYHYAQHIVRNAPKEAILNGFAPAESPNSSIGGMAISVAQGLVHGTTNTLSRIVTGVTRSFQGSSQGDLSRIRDAYVRYVHNHCTTAEEKDVLRWSLLGVRKVAEAYANEEGPKQILEDIYRIATNALNNILPAEKPLNFGTEWSRTDVLFFHKMLHDSFAAMQALTQLETSVKPGIAKNEKLTLGASLQNAIENALKVKADQYETTVRLALAAQAARYQKSEEISSQKEAISQS